MATRKLTAKQKRFCEEYVIDLNATQAAIRAGYSEKTAKSQGSTLLTNPNVGQHVSRLNEKASSELKVTKERVIEELARIAFADPRKLYGESGNLKNVVDLDDDTAATVASMEVSESYEEGEVIGELKKLKQWDKIKALNLLGKHLGMFVHKVEVTNNQPKVVLYWPNNGKDQSNARSVDVIESK